MGRGKNYLRRHKILDAIQTRLYAGGWAARGAYLLGLQGKLHIDRRNIHLPIRPHLAEPLKIAFASDIHAGPLTDPRLFDILLDSIVDFRHTSFYLAETLSRSIIGISDCLPGILVSYKYRGEFLAYSAITTSGLMMNF